MKGSVVYVIGPASGPLKIGVSSNVHSRLAGLQVSAFVRLKIHGIWKCADAPLLERQAHAELQHCRLEGEWFDAPLGTIQEVLNRLSGEKMSSAKRKRVESDVDTDWYERQVAIEPYTGESRCYKQSVGPHSRSVAYVSPNDTAGIDAQVRWAKQHGVRKEEIFVDQKKPRCYQWKNAWRFVRAGDTILMHTALVLGESSFASIAIANFVRRGVRVILAQKSQS